MAKLLIPILLVFLACGAGLGWLWWSQSGPFSNAGAAPSLRQSPPLAEFALTDAAGSTFHSSELAGKIWVASYFFTQCGGNCRMLNMEISKLEQEYGPHGVRFVSLTCDPTRDSPEELARYAELFKANAESWTFLTGELPYLQRIGQDFFELSISERAHYAQLTIIDRDGKSQGTFHALIPADLRRAKGILDDLLELDPESSPASQAATPSPVES